MKKKIELKLSTLIISVVVIILLAFGGIKYHNYKVNKLNDKVETEVKLRNALTDQLKYYKNKEKEWVAEKLTIQVSLKDLKKLNEQLTVSQKELLKRITEINKKNDIIAAALIETQFKLDSLYLHGNITIDTTNKTVIFDGTYVDSSKIFTYKMVVGNVIPFPKTLKPTLYIDSIFIPNKQFIEFHWKNDRKKGYPVAFSISNSNGLFTTTNIDSYIIPEISKEVLNPNLIQKFGNFFIRNGEIMIYIGVGGIVGASTMFLLMR